MTRAEVLQLVRFLLDRIDEDEDILARNGRAETRNGATPPPTRNDIDGTTRLTAEAIAKRHVIGDMQMLALLRDLPAKRLVRDTAINALLQMALPYRGQRLFRATWPNPVDRTPRRPPEAPDGTEPAPPSAV